MLILSRSNTDFHSHKFFNIRNRFINLRFADKRAINFENLHFYQFFNRNIVITFCLDLLDKCAVNLESAQLNELFNFEIIKTLILNFLDKFRRDFKNTHFNQTFH